MKHNVLAPRVGESITEVSILKWAKQNGQAVKTGELLAEIETDKATVEVVAEVSGAVTLLKQPGERIPVGEIIAVIDDEVKGTEAAAVAPAKPAGKPVEGEIPLSPAVRKAVIERGLSPQEIAATGKGGRITKGDVLQHRAAPAAAPAQVTGVETGRPERRVRMSILRSRIAQRLVQAQHTAAILTTFNEADMSAVLKLRAEHKDAFKAKHGVSLGFMSFFTRAGVEALKAIPEVNAYLENDEVVYHDYCDIGVAVGTERGLVVPVVRNAEKMGFVEIEKKIAELAIKARDSKLSIADLSGGTFTISNGGVYGSLLSTPILNPPQSGILGMHKIQERPIAVEGKIEIRPMMYLALSYDHRLIDGKGAVTFLVTLKDYLEHPEKLGLEY